GSRGRSTATTIASLAAVRWLRSNTRRRHMQKLLAFTDNRHEASLQAWHFNDFVQTSLVRSPVRFLGDGDGGRASNPMRTPAVDEAGYSDRAEHRLRPSAA